MGDGRQSVQRRTFYLLGCEACGRFEKPPRPLRSNIASPVTEPMRCELCNELLLLVEGWVADETAMWQRKSGAQWHHVIFLGELPERDGRQVWTRA